MAESLMLGSMLLPACLGESDRSRQAGMAMDQSAADGLFLCRQIFHRLDDPWAGDDLSAPWSPLQVACGGLSVCLAEWQVYVPEGSAAGFSGCFVLNIVLHRFVLSLLWIQ